MKEEHNFTLGGREGVEYLKKYEKLSEKYEDLRETLQK